MVDILSGIRSTAAALDVERTRLDVISQNIANANTTHGVDGKPYQRQVVVFETALQQAMNGGASVPTLRVAGIEKDQRPFETIYEPGNPDADAHGMVAMPNVNINEEMAAKYPIVEGRNGGGDPWHTDGRLEVGVIAAKPL